MLMKWKIYRIHIPKDFVTQDKQQIVVVVIRFGLFPFFSVRNQILVSVGFDSSMTFQLFAPFNLKFTIHDRCLQVVSVNSNLTFVSDMIQATFFRRKYCPTLQSSRKWFMLNGTKILPKKKKMSEVLFLIFS